MSRALRQSGQNHSFPFKSLSGSKFQVEDGRSIFEKGTEEEATQETNSQLAQFALKLTRAWLVRFAALCQSV